ncbi:MAG: hypothetical protein PHV75_03460 [Victivallaceae bacterium]|nr:hypothetical protein [Victivallaceae bacterium]MDD3702822.1 hypothetical protein [Victivallaceae bacterium]MDD4317554.1 hypothetical protein [Victivallaceae bacterium]MDD5664276.1 hypothetical protein [Victivallaceae bacterium]
MNAQTIITRLILFLFFFVMILFLIAAIPILLVFLIIALLFPGSRSFVKSKRFYPTGNFKRGNNSSMNKGKNIPPSEEIIDISAQEIPDDRE